MSFNVCMIIPTGVGCEIGGHAGDANPVARLLGKVCDKLILHPNVVNASDINEMPENALYVEGAMLNTFLAGHIKLKEVRANRILVVANEVEPVTVNCIQAAMNTIGIEADLVTLDDEVYDLDPMRDAYERKPLVMIGEVSDTYASGTIENLNTLYRRIDMAMYHAKKNNVEYGAIAIHTPITVPMDVKMRYLNQECSINPWGGVEAKLSKLLYNRFGIPNAHAPIETMPEFDEIVDERLSAEVIGGSHLFCVLKGLHKAPQPNEKEGIDHIDALVSPMCYGDPHRLTSAPIIYVEENRTASKEPIKLKDKDYVVKSYMEAAGLLLALRNGMSVRSVGRKKEDYRS